jgi:glycosyltransferase involved in cell wall biosynthesis
MQKSIAVVAPVFNEEECILEFIKQITEVFDNNQEYAWRLILVENGSTDESWNLMSAARQTRNDIDVIRLSRNFGMDGGLAAGLRFVREDAVILMVSDLQDPPHAIPLFVKKWQEGFDNVFAIVSKRNGVPLLRRINSQIFYLIANKMTGNLIPKNVSDFRLLSKRCYQQLIRLEEVNPVLRGLIAWLGFESTGIRVERAPRFGGKSKAYSWKVIGLGIRAILAHSLIPLRFISLMGAVLSIGAFLTLIITTVLFLTSGVPFPGFGTLLTVIVLLFGLLFSMLGMIAEYVGMTYQEVKRRPNFIVKDTYFHSD